MCSTRKDDQSNVLRKNSKRIIFFFCIKTLTRVFVWVQNSSEVKPLHDTDYRCYLLYVYLHFKHFVCIGLQPNTNCYANVIIIIRILAPLRAIMCLRFLITCLPGLLTHSCKAFCNLLTWSGFDAMPTKAIISRNSSSPASQSCCKSSPPVYLSVHNILLVRNKKQKTLYGCTTRYYEI